jgi:hypothetical protein
MMFYCSFGEERGGELSPHDRKLPDSDLPFFFEKRELSRMGKQTVTRDRKMCAIFA